MLWAQDEGIQTKNELGAEALVRDVFIKGDCRNVSNIMAIGNEEFGIGQFENGGDIIGLEDGIIISTGKTVSAVGPNVSNESTFSFDILSDDSDLEILATSTLYDVTGIEFDFVPIGNRVTFEYVFASEEYCEFVGTEFNDVFGFFVSGPGINGPFDNNAINVAKLNLTDEYVSINTVNHLTNTNSYINNVTNTNILGCGDFSSEFLDVIEYDGFTVPLLASIDVIPCETYRIRLVIGDVGDAFLDSAVFLETNSFDLGEGMSVHAEVPGRSEPIAFESCVDGQFVFTRSPTSNFNEDFVIEYSISSDSEASNGVDFLEIPLSVTIPAGQNTFTLPITLIEDNIPEGLENLQLELVYECECIDPANSELIINEASELSAVFENVMVCADQSFSIEPEISGGISPFDYRWSTGAETESLNISVSEPTDFTVTITDFCGSEISGAIAAGIQSTPFATLDGVFDFCDIQDRGIEVSLEGNPPWTIAYSVDGVEQAPINNIQTSPLFLDAPTAGTYELIAFNDVTCSGSFVGIAVVNSTFNIDANIVRPTCFNSADGSIEITGLDAIEPFTISWDVAREDNFFLENLSEGTYTISVLDGNDCLYERSFELGARLNNDEACSPVYIPNSFSPNRDGINDVFSIYASANSRIQNILSMEVFSRWGEALYEQRNFLPDNGLSGWDGSFRGEPMGQDVFVYTVFILLEDGNTQLLKGNVTLVR